MEAAAGAKPQCRTGPCRLPEREIDVLKNSLDLRIPLAESLPLPLPPAHDNIGGTRYFGVKEERQIMLQQPMKEKLQCSRSFPGNNRSTESIRNRTKRRGG